MKIFTAAVLALAMSACAAPEPTPEPTSEPTPEPTPQIVEVEVIREVEVVREVEVEVTPDACRRALMWMVDDGALAWTLIGSLYDDYLDYPDEDLAEFGRRVEERLTGFDPGEPFEAVEPDIDACLAS